MSHDAFLDSDPDAFVGESWRQIGIKRQPPFSESVFIGWDYASTKLLHEFFVERVKLEVGEYGGSTLVPEGKLPITEHVGGKSGSDLIERAFQMFSKCHLKRETIL